MQLYHQHSEFYDKPILLTEEEKDDPRSVLRYFFEAHHLHEIRQVLNDCLETALTSENHLYAQASERDSLVYFYRELEIFIEAVYVFDQSNKNVEQKKKKGKKK